MPPKRKAAAGRKRSPSKATTSGAPDAQRQKTTAAPAVEEEEQTTIEVYGFHKDWLTPLDEMYVKGELTDVVLAAGDTTRAVHRVVLATVSPVLRKMFATPMAESQSRQIELQDVSELALPAIVEFAYTGKVVLSGSTVVAIIQAANHLQMDAVERAAVDFLVERLDAGNVLSSLALGEHLQAGTLGRELRDKSRAWLDRNFGLVAAEPAFLALPAAEVAGVLESDGLRAKVRKTPRRPRSWANFSLLMLYSHRNAWANLHLLGQPNTFLAQGGGRLRGGAPVGEGRRGRAQDRAGAAAAAGPLPDDGGAGPPDHGRAPGGRRGRER
jgi:hypothetical protein